MSSMRSDNFVLKQGDTLPALRRTLYNADLSPIDLTTATELRFHLKTTTGAIKVDALAMVIDTAGVVQYDWQEADTDTAGVFLAEFEVTFLSGDVLTVPNEDNMIVRVVAQLN